MYIIGITGGTASGKSTFVSLLRNECSQLPINFISQDDYYKDTTLLSLNQRSLINFDHPDSLDFELLHQNLQSLIEGKQIQKPLYSFTKHNRLKRTETIKPLPILILEGILVLCNPLIKNLCNTTIFIDTPEELRIKRRIKRDVIERGRTEESVLHQFKKNITPMHLKFIAPLKEAVDYIFDGSKDFEEAIKTTKELLSKVDC